ncbi:MAG: DUF6502 family protein [Burkholderiales bacterium]
MQSRHNPLPIAPGDASEATLDALFAVLCELSRLSMDGGVLYGQLDDLLKRALIFAALRAAREHGGDTPVPFSRLSVMTGIHRKEVKRVAESLAGAPVRRHRAPAAEVFTRWVTDPAWQDPSGRPLVLPRRIDRADVLSFEKLARAVTTDVHPKTLLDELLRLRLVVHDTTHDTVALRADAFVPVGEVDRLFELAGGALADHVAAVRVNLSTLAGTGGGDDAMAPFLEQSLFADALSDPSARESAQRAAAFWRELLRTMAPALQRLEDGDREAGRPATHRIRIGMYCYAEALESPTAVAGDASEGRS